MTTTTTTSTPAATYECCEHCGGRYTSDLSGRGHGLYIPQDAHTVPCAAIKCVLGKQPRQTTGAPA